MGVHNIAEYVKYHQEKLREQNRREASTTSSSAASIPTQKRKGGVNKISSKSGFETSVVEGSKSQLVVVDCFATWCGPCKVIAPTVAKFSEEFSNAGFYKIDVDELNDVAADLGIRAMPTFLLFKDGKKIGEVVGADPNALKRKIQEHY